MIQAILLIYLTGCFCAGCTFILTNLWTKILWRDCDVLLTPTEILALSTLSWVMVIENLCFSVSIGWAQFQELKDRSENRKQ